MSNLPILDDAWRHHPLPFSQVITDGMWRPYKWLQLLSKKVFNAIMMGGGRLIVNVPPRLGKSLFLSTLLPTWYLESFPNRRIILTCYGDALARDFGSKIRNLFATNDLLNTKLRADSTAAGRWDTQSGGGMIATGAAGPLTGRGGDLILVDDIHKNWSEAHSHLKLDNVWDWFKGTLQTRAEPNATIVLLMQRWSMDDLAGRLLREPGSRWEHLNLPAIAMPGIKDELGRSPGESLCPERYSIEEYKNIKSSVGQFVWESCYQQAPSSVAEHQMYPNFDESKHVKERANLVPGYPIDISTDFNIDPGMHFLIGQYYEKRNFMVDCAEFHEPRLTIPKGCKLIYDALKRHGALAWVKEVRLFGDASGHHESPQSGSSDYDIMIQCLTRLLPPEIQITLCVPRKAPSIRDSVNAVNETLQDVDGRIHYALGTACPILIRDFKYMKFTAEGTVDKRDKHMSHAVDAARYRIAYLRPIRGFTPKSEAPFFIPSTPKHSSKSIPRFISGV